jgi:predicted dehydrogenase
MPPPTNPPVNMAVIGCGKMGKLHARVCSQMPSVKLVGVHDADPDYANAVADQYNTTAFASLPELLKHAQAAVIAVPTRHHVAVGLRCLEAGLDVLIEKPLAGTVAECRTLADAGAKHDRLIQVGHVERFNPVVRAMTAQELRPKFIEVTRVSPLTFRSIDVGVVLDMMIHDIDIVLLLARGAAIESVEAVGVSVIGDVEDVCNARVRFGGEGGGCVANLTASRLALKTDRRLRVFSPDAYVSLDYAKKYGIIARRGGNLAAIRDTVARIRAGEIEDMSQLNYTDLVQIEELTIDDVEPLRAELESFVHAVTTRSRPLVSANDGLAAVDLATRIVAAIGNNSLA